MGAEAANDLARFNKVLPPVKRAAYSDRTAALMAAFAELAYEPLDEEKRGSYLRLAGEFAELTDQGDIAAKLRAFAQMLTKGDTTDNAVLKQALSMGNFKLKGALYCSQSFVRSGFFAHDTQGYVAYRDADPATGGLGLVVVCFRGTQQLRDWLTNINLEKAEVWSQKDPDKLLGHFHLGFHDAYKSVENQILDHLVGLESLPLYITGHSLGGALATIATWYLPGENLAACYTFGAPRCGDRAMQARYRTPIYRIVNGADPVPFIPPSGAFLDGLKWILRMIGTVVGPIKKIGDFIVRIQHFRHYGDQRYLPMLKADQSGKYPRFQIQTNVNPLQRLIRTLARARAGVLKRPDKYHSMDQYRRKLRVYSEWRLKGEV